MFSFLKKKRDDVDLDEISESLDLNQDEKKKDSNIIDVKLKVLSLDIFHEAYNLFIILEYNKKTKKIIDPSTNDSKLAVIKDNGEVMNEKQIESYEHINYLFGNRINFEDKLSIYAVKDLAQVISIKAMMDDLNDQSLELNMLNYDGNKNIKIPTSQQGIAYINYNIDYSDFCNDNFISDEEVVNANIIGAIPFDKISYYDFNVKYYFAYEKGNDEEFDKKIDEFLEAGYIEPIDNNPNQFAVIATFFTDNDGITFVNTY